MEGSVELLSRWDGEERIGNLDEIRGHPTNLCLLCVDTCFVSIGIFDRVPTTGMECGGVGPIRIFDNCWLFGHHNGLCLWLLRLGLSHNLNHNTTGLFMWCDRWFGLGDEGLFLVGIGCDDLLGPG